MPDDPHPDRIWSGAGPYRMTWSDFGVLADRLAARIAADGFRPDVVCGVARGGLVPAAHLAIALDVERLHVVRVRRTADDAVYAAKVEARLRVLTPGGLSGARDVLIVDDIVGTGATAALVESHVRSAAAGDVRLAALARNGRSGHRPDYRGVDVDDWVVFPWETADAAARPLDLAEPVPWPAASS